MTILPRRIDLFKRLPRGTVGVEVGVLRGELSAQILATPVSYLYLVDPWKAQGKDTYNDDADSDDHEQNMRDTIHNTCANAKNLSRVRLIRGLSAEVAHNQPLPPLDWVYLDGNHAYANVMEDLIVWSRKLKPEGRLMGHDYTESHETARRLGFGVVPAVHNFCEHCGWMVEAITNEEFPSYSLRRTP